MKKYCIALWLCCFSLLATAQLQTIEITEGVDNPTVIAIVPFNYIGQSPLNENVSQIISNDLRNSGQFRALKPDSMLSFPAAARDVVYRDWRLLGSEYLVIGSIKSIATGYSLSFSLFDVLSQRAIIPTETVEVGPNNLRDMAHFVSDRVFEAITGIRGAFSTRILYIEAKREANLYRLMVADADGARARELYSSSQPLLSPAWSPDGKSVAYVSFETSRPAIFRQNIASGQREQLTNFRGLNGAPAWSPDGRKLALVLSKDGNPEIYTLDLASKRFTRLTNHFGIDTEPTWAVDGQSVIFTSNRGGKPQIYQVRLASGQVERLTFEGDYNARAQLSPDGKSLVVVHRNNGVFHIALQDMKTGDLRVLTQTNLDESPSIAPNGAMLIYATQVGGKGILAAVSLDAGVKFRLPSRSGDIREPAWSPYFD